LSSDRILILKRTAECGPMTGIRDSPVKSAKIGTHAISEQEKCTYSKCADPQDSEAVSGFWGPRRRWNSRGESRREGQAESRSSKKRAGRGFGQAQVAIPVLGGLHHEYRLAKVAA
jgi:hypothetical protein